MAALNLTLVRDCLNNVEDGAGRWQVEGGKAFQGRQHVANYSSVKRVSCGTHEQNTAQLWASSSFSSRIGKQFKRVANTLTIA